MSIPSKYDLSNFKYKNDTNKALAQDLYGEKGYCVINDFVTEEEVEYIIKNYVMAYDYSLQESCESGQKELKKYFYKNRKSDNDIKIKNIIQKVFDKRNEIMLQENSDFFALQYCMKHNLDINNIYDISQSQMDHTTCRLTHYKNGGSQDEHLDFPGEIQAMIFLTQYGKDYEKGGLNLHYDDNKHVEVDSIAKVGDLVLLRSYTKRHSVSPIQTTNDQIGRITLFVYLHPDWLWGRCSAFRENIFKIHFIKGVPLWEKISVYMKHLIKIGLLKKPFTDQAITKR